MSEKKITVHNCIKCDQNEVYWNVKNSAWYCSTCGFYRGEKLEMVKPIIINNLPTELVDKYFNLVPDLENYKELQEQCAQIAVDYADEQLRIGVSELIEENQELTGENYILKQQRDELIELLEETVLHIKYLNSKFQETGSGNSLLTRIKSKLKKHEDGKE